METANEVQYLSPGGNQEEIHVPASENDQVDSYPQSSDQTEDRVVVDDMIMGLTYEKNSMDVNPTFVGLPIIDHGASKYQQLHQVRGFCNQSSIS